MAKRAAGKKRPTPRKHNPSPLHRYLYVEVRGWFNEERQLDQPISFDSVQLRARDESDAYHRGPALLQAQQVGDTTGHLTGDLMNDYVVRL